MMKIIRSLKQLDFRQLMDVYTQSNRENGRDFFPHLTAQVQLLQAEQAFYAYLQDEFFSDTAALYAVWEAEGRYVAALRLEPYTDGLLLEGLETAPQARGKGYATQLVDAVLSYLRSRGGVKVYSHVEMRNTASLAVHKACGFEIKSDHAVYIDGSVSHKSYTLCCYAE